MACSGDGKPAQLAALPGHPAKQIRKTDDTPPRIAAIDVASATTGKHARNTTRYVLVVQEKLSEVFQTSSNFCCPPWRALLPPQAFGRCTGRAKHGQT